MSAGSVVRTWTVRALLAVAGIASAGAVAVARAGVQRRRGGEVGAELIVMHRLLRGGRDGSWTWCVRGAMVPASRTTDVCLEIDPGADSHYCPDCLLGSVRLGDAGTGILPCAVACGDCGSLFGLACVIRRE